MRAFLFALVASMLCVVCAVMAQNSGANTPPPDPNTVKLNGDRFRPLAYQQMSPAQKKMLENVLAGERRGAGGPFNVMLRSPEIGDLAQQFGASVRFHSSMPPRLNEMAIIITARHWTSHYEWYVHRRAAEQAGLSKAIVEAIAQRRRPASMTSEETAVYDFCTELLSSHRVSDRTFQAAKDAFGERGVVDLISVSGYYGLVSMLLNVDRYPLPDGVKPELN